MQNDEGLRLSRLAQRSGITRRVRLPEVWNFENQKSIARQSSILRPQGSQAVRD
jgi:hypothetical protein